MGDSRTIATRIAGFYAVLALSWIFLSDYVAGMLPEPYFSAIQPIKGSLFVLVTAVALYIVIERVADRFVREASGARAVERMLSQVVSRMPVGIIITSAEGRVTFLNKAAEEMLKLVTPDAATRPVDEVMGSDSPETAALLGHVMRSGESEIIPIITAEGEPRYVVAHAAHIDPDAKAAGWVIAFTEVTHKQEGIAQLERSANGHKLLAEVAEASARATDAVALARRITELAADSELYAAAWGVWIDRADLRHTEIASPGMGDRMREVARLLAEDDVVRLLGMDSVEPDASPVVVANDVVGDPSNPWSSAAGEEGIGSAATVRIDSGTGTFGLITFFAEETGAFGAEDVELLTRIADDASFACGRLVLERHRESAEEEVSDSEKAYRELFFGHPTPMWVYDLDTLAFLAVNDAALAKYRYTRDEFLSMTIADIRPKDDVPALLRNISALRDGFEDAGIWAHRDADGRQFPVHVYSHTIEWGGHPAELVMAMEVARFE